VIDTFHAHNLSQRDGQQMPSGSAPADHRRYPNAMAKSKTPLAELTEAERAAVAALIRERTYAPRATSWPILIR